MAGSAQRAAHRLRQRAFEEGCRPYALECGPDYFVELYGDQLAGTGDRIFGMQIVARAAPGVAVLALPNRRIGRFEVVVPQRFERETA